MKKIKTNSDSLSLKIKAIDLVNGAKNYLTSEEYVNGMKNATNVYPSSGEEGEELSLSLLTRMEDALLLTRRLVYENRLFILTDERASKQVRLLYMQSVTIDDLSDIENWNKFNDFKKEEEDVS